MGGSGVQRPLKFVKYLREFGWNPIVLCPEPGAYHTFDESLYNELKEQEIEVHRVHANTPFHRLGQKEKLVKVPHLLAKVLRWISTFIYFPDNKKDWIDPGLSKAMELIKEKSIKAVFSTAPPYSNLMIAKQIKEKTGLPVVMDLRDEWLESHLINYPTKWHKEKMKRLELDTLSKADALLTINNTIANSIKSRILKDVEVIRHGFDPEDFSAKSDFSLPTEKIRFLYSGLFYPDSRPDSFLKAIAEIISETPELKDKLELQFQGGLNSEHWKLINELELEPMVVDFGYIDHDIAVQNLMNADILWLNIGQKKNAEIISLGKTSEYFATKKPVLGLVPEGEAKEMLKKYGNSFTADPYKISDIKIQLYSIIEIYKHDDWNQPAEEFIKSFNRRNLTGELAQIFDKISPQ
jgi:glycosyltransferase involved in cell wall biosynthesis